MKKLLFSSAILAFLTLALSAANTQAAVDPGLKYVKLHMHRIFANANNAQMSLKLKRYDVAEIYLRNLLAEVREVRLNLPEMAAGYKLDRERFLTRLTELEDNVKAVKRSVTGGGEGAHASVKDPERFFQKVFNACAGCHEEVGLKYLFRLPGQRSPFAEYMHKIREHVDIARIHSEEKGSPKNVEENMRLVSYYLDLLKEIFPESGPTGVVFDRENFSRRLKEVRTMSEAAVKESSAGKQADIDAFRQAANSLCVACHEPERLK